MQLTEADDEPEAGETPGAGSGPEVALRTPVPADAAAIWRLVRDSGSLDLNSPYAYLLLCSHFAETSLVATAGGRLLGFVGAYRPPTHPDSVFVWQIATARPWRGRGIASRLLDALPALPGCRGVRALEATVTPSNRGSRALFLGFARRRGAPCREDEAFPRVLFPAACDHEEEIRLRIGPLAGPPSHPIHHPEENR